MNGIPTHRFDLTGRVAVVTGATGRMGTLVHTPALIEAGATVYGIDLADRHDEESYHHVVADVTDENQVHNSFADIKRREGRLDILVNNAVVDPALSDASKAFWMPPAEFPLQSWDQQMAVGLTSYFITMKAAMAFMGHVGSVINVASQLGVKAPRQREYPDGFYKSPAYTTLKHAVIGLTKAWAASMARDAPGIRVNALCPASVDFGTFTPEFANVLGNRNMLGRPIKPEEIAGPLVFLASDASAGMTGSVLMVDGGEHAW